MQTSRQLSFPFYLLPVTRSTCCCWGSLCGFCRFATAQMCICPCVCDLWLESATLFRAFCSVMGLFFLGGSVRGFCRFATAQRCQTVASWCVFEETVLLYLLCFLTEGQSNITCTGGLQLTAGTVTTRGQFVTCCPTIVRQMSNVNSRGSIVVTIWNAGCSSGCCPWSDLCPWFDARVVDA